MKISEVIFDIEDDQKRLQEIEQQIAKEGFWDNPEENKSILKKRSSLSNRIEKYNKLTNDLEENQILLDLAVEESDEEALAEVSQQISGLDQRIGGLSLELMLDGEDDGKNAIVSINAGAGGTEAQDWAEMLFRMYSRWVERRGYKLELIDFQP
ncbi:MAG: PCRF domain-containing protein, partial [Desulfobacterales bacterium]